MNVVRWIVYRFAPPEWRESLLGDIEEERHRRLVRGQSAGEWWASAAAIGAVWSLGRGRRAERQGGATHMAGSMFDGIWHDVRWALRSLRATPGVTATALIVLALGIGASTAIFSVVDAVLLRGLPFDRAERLVAVGEIDSTRPATVPAFVGSVAAVNYLEWLERQTVFASIGAARVGGGFTIREGDEPETLMAAEATASLFDVLRVRPRMGRVFTKEHEVAGRHRVLLIGDHLWRRRFNADPAIVGKTMTFDDGTWEIIGVLPPGFTYPLQLPQPNDLVAPYVVPERERLRVGAGRTYSLRVVARLHDGVTIDRARADMARITAGLAAEHPQWFKDRASVVHALHDSVVGRARDWMWMLLAGVGCVLLIACANVANLLLARATTRAREMRVRAVLGASRWRIARGLLVESLVLSGIGLTAALLLGAWGISVLRASMPEGIPRMTTIALDARVFVAAAAAAVVTGLLCGLAPAWQISRPDLHGALRDGGRGGTAGRARQRLRAGLVIVEVALAVVLLVGAGLFVSSFVRLVMVDLGFEPRHVMTASLSPRLVSIDEKGFGIARARTRDLAPQVLDRLRVMPGVEAAALIEGGSPLSGSWRTGALTVSGKPAFMDPADEIQTRSVTPEYLDVMRVPLVRGRYVLSTDTAGAPRVVVLNQEAARRFFDGRDPVGSRVRFNDETDEYLVVGVVGNVHLRGPLVPVSPEAYMAFAQQSVIGGTIVVRLSPRAASAFEPVLRQVVLSVLPDVPVRVTTFEASLRRMTAVHRFNTLLVGLFGVLAIAIAAVGVYGVMAYTVAQRTAEIGVRMALGARPGGVLAMVLGRAAALMAAGVAIGLAGAWLLAGMAEAFLFEARPHDPAVFAGVVVLLAAIGLVAAFVPARRAARVDPIVALRAD